MINTLITLLVIVASLYVYYIINSFMLKNKLKKYTPQYRVYFEKEHIKKSPILYIFFTMFIFLYNNYHKDEIEYGYLKYKVDLIDRIKNDNYIQITYPNMELAIEGEGEIRKKMKNYSLKIKLKKIKKMNDDDK